MKRLSTYTTLLLLLCHVLSWQHAAAQKITNTPAEPDPGFFTLTGSSGLSTSNCDSTFFNIYGTPFGDEFGRAIAKVPDALGGGFIVGGGKDNLAMLTLLDAGGNIVWTSTFNPTSDAGDFIVDLRFDSDNNLIGSGLTKSTPTNNIECFVFKYNLLTNTILWVNELDLDDPAIEAYHSVFEKTPGGNYLVAGEVVQLLGGTGCNGVLLEIDRNCGATVWQRYFTLGSCETFQRTIAANNAIYTTGRYNFDGGGTARMRPAITKFDPAGNQLWSRLYLRPVTPNHTARLYAMDIADDNGLVVAGWGDNNGTSTTDVSLFLFRTDYNGTLQWAMNYDIPGANSEFLTRLLNLPDGYLCLGYFTASSQDAFIFKTDKQGKILWSKSFGSPGTEDGMDMFWHNALIYFTGNTRGIANSSEDFYLASLTPDGNPAWVSNCNFFVDLTITSAPYSDSYDAQHDLFSLHQSFGLFVNPAPTTLSTFQVMLACASPCTDEVCGNGLDDDGDGYVDCYDTDCPCNFSDCAVNPSNLEPNFTARLAWQSTIDEVSVSATPIVANLNPQVDDLPEIIVIESKSDIISQLSTDLLIFKGNGNNAANPRRLTITGGYVGYPAVGPTVGDLNGDGIPELAMVSADGHIRVFGFYDENATDPMQELLVSTDLVADPHRRPYLADFDEDGKTEIYVGDEVFLFDAGLTTLTKVLSGGSSAGLLFYQNYQQPNCSPVAIDILSAADCFGDPDCEGLELAAGNLIYSIDLSITDGDGFEIKIQRDLNLLQAQHLYLDGYTAVADVDLDGILDVVVSSGRDNTEGVYVWNKNGLVQWFGHPPFADPGHSGGLPCIANVYDDTQSGAVFDFPEILVCSQFSLNCYNVNAAVLGMPDKVWWDLPTSDASGVTGVTVFDFNGDGTEEIVCRDEDKLRILYGGAFPFPPGVDPDRNWFTFTAGSGTFDEHPVVADVNNDGQANIVTSSYTFAGTNDPPADYRGRLRVFEADPLAGHPWLSARPVWNQYNYFVVNVNDDLSIPVQQQLHHLEFPNPGSDYRPFNRFAAQSPLLDSNFLPFLPVPDATLTLDTVHCGAGSLHLFFTICNEGDAPLPQHTPLTFYLDDPMATTAPLFAQSLTEIAIAPGECFSQMATLPAVSGVVIFGVVNDDGSLPTPYNLTSDFPVTNILECNYANNLGSIPVQFSPPMLDLGADTILCEFGGVVLDAGGGFAGYLWQDGSMEQTFTVTQPGTYWVVATDSCGGEQIDSITVSLSPAGALDLGPDVEICLGQSYTFNVSGFASYEWAPADFLSCSLCPDPVATPPASTTYTLTVAAADGCTGLDSVLVTVLTAVETFDTVSICSGDTIFIFGNPVTAAGTFTQTFPLPNGCDSTHAITVEVLMGIEIVEDRILCEGDTVFVFGMPVTTTGEFSQVFTASNGCDSVYTISVGLLEKIFTYDTLFICFGETADVFGAQTGTPGTYSMTFVASNTCDSVHTIELIAGDEIVLDLTAVHVSCFGEANGSVSASVSGGSGGFTYLWGGGETGASLAGLAAGTYSLTATDSQGCTAIAAIEITQPAELENLLSSTDATCAVAGMIGTSVAGGTPPYTYAWSNGAATPAIAGLSAGTYSVTVTDANGCTHVGTTTIAGSVSPVVGIAVVSPVTTNQPNGGALTAQISGGTAPFQIAWSNGAATASIANLASGTYSVTVTDANGCSASASAYLYLPACTGGIIWNDLDRDGCQDVNELGIAGIHLSLTGTDIWGNAVAASTVSNIFGNYLFDNLPPGSYKVSFTVPSGHVVSPANACADDFTDSDFNQNGVTIDNVVLVEGHCCLIVAGGLYDACLNVINPGTICCNQTLCGPGVTPAPITGTAATGAGGPIEYMWIYHVANGNWQPVLNAAGQPVTSATYAPGPLSQTTWFRRCVRALGCSTWLESNIVQITVGSVAVAHINGPDLVCVGKPATYTATPNPAGAKYSWNFGYWSTPATSNQPSATVTWNAAGVVYVKLSVVYGGCTSTDVMGVAITNHPAHCSNAVMAQGSGSTVQPANGPFVLSGQELFSVYPNPVETLLRIKWNSGEVDTDVQVEFFGVEGRLLRQAVAPKGDGQFAVDMSDWSPGFYLLRLTYNDAEQTLLKIVR